MNLETAGQPLKQQEEALFDAAQQLTDARQRAAFLDAACDGNAELRRRLDGLFTAQPEADAFFEKPPAIIAGAKLTSVAAVFGFPLADGQAAEPAAAEKPKTPRANGPATEGSGDRIGRYKLLEKLGEGGFGEVWMAEQKEPVKRRVALKIIKLGMDSKQVVARFEAERQALALMDHPNIAKVLDGGATETGRPYFVMELVRGVRITEYCEEHQLSLVEQLDLFIKVCQAIQHAHQKGVIHRDIKPANILVTVHDGVPVPKVIDFGIAKATHQELTDKTVFTQFHQFIGTPAYMSPEQAEMSGLDIDTRSDIYSLGVLLYELLIGQTPFDAKELMALGLDAMRKTIREKEPVRPSTRLSQTLGAAGARRLTSKSEIRNPKSEIDEVSPRQHLQARETIALLRGDLDWIVMKCLEKDRSRRYETANGLAMDIQRYLKNEPVLARPPNATYRLRKMIRRNRIAFAAAATVVSVLVLGTVVSTWQAIRATRAEQEQAHHRRMAEANELKAQQAQANEARERQAAEEARQNEADLRRRAEAQAYAADMNLAQQALAVNNLGRAWELLNRHRPARGAVGNPLYRVSQQPNDAAFLTTNHGPLTTDLRGWEWRYLWQLCQNDAQYTLTQRSNSIKSLSVSHDRKWLAVGEVAEGGLSLWDLETRREIRRLPAGEGEVVAAFSPRDALLAFSLETRELSTNRPFSICLWRDQQVVARLPLQDRCHLLVFSQDGRILVTHTRGSEARISAWQIPEGTKLFEYRLARYRASPGTSVAVTRDLSLAAQAVGGFAKDGGLRLIDLKTGTERWNVPVGDSYIASIAFSPDAKILAIAEGAGQSAIRLWDVESGRETGRLEGHRAYVLGLEFSPDGRTLASASADQTTRLWNMDTRESIATLRGHRLEVWRTALLPESRRLASGCKDGSVMVWDVATIRREPVPLTLSVPIRAWCFTPDSRSVHALEAESVTRWRGPDFQLREVLLEISPAPNPVTPMLLSKFSSDGELVAVRQANGVISVWDLPRRTLRQRIQSAHGFVVPWLLLPQAGKLLGAQLDSNSIHEWDLATGQETRSWMVPTPLRSAAPSPDEHWCLALGFGEQSPLRELIGVGRTNGTFHATPHGSWAISPDGKLLATLSRFNSLKLRETATLRELHTFGSVLMGNHSVAFSPDGRRLTAGSIGNEAIKMWDVESRREVLTLETPSESDQFVSTGFSPDGNLLGAMNRQGILHLWRAPSWAEIEAAELELAKVRN